MNTASITLTDTTLDELQPDRLEHWRGLPSPELFVELQARTGRAHTVLFGSERIGYLVLADNGVLLEIDVRARDGMSRSEIATSVVRSLGIDRIWCLSFDTDTLELCDLLCDASRAIGIACREYRRRPRLPHEFEARLAEPSDLPAILLINEQEVLESPEEASDYVMAERLFLFESGAELLGFGVMTPIMTGRPEVDIGMLVAPKFRGNGYGAAFIQFLAEHVLGLGQVPVCGCDVNNHASRRSLENAGFVTEHRLLEFRVREIPGGRRHIPSTDTTRTP